jgi:Prp8 binding protein
MSAATFDDSPPPGKRLKQNENAMISYSDNVRTSSLAEPTLKLSGHKGSIYCLSYSKDGQVLASAGFDMNVFLWNASFGTYENYNVLNGHKNAILDLKFYNSEFLVTCSADKTLGWWNADTGVRVKKCQGHARIVNAVDVVNGDAGAPPLAASASDDGTVILWDMRTKKPAGVLEDNQSTDLPLALTAVAYNFDQSTVYSGGIDNMIHAWDIKMMRKTFSLKGHTDTITCLSLHPESTHLLSNSMDNTVRSWDIRPYTQNKQTRLHKTFVGATHNAEKGLLKCSWNHNGSMVTAGSADRMVHIWDELSAEELYLLPGHSGCVNTVVFSPTETNVIASGSSDKSIYVGELGQ